MKFLLLCVALLACEVKAGSPYPPPIAAGKCLADVYEGAVPMTQTCTYVGYSWACVYDKGLGNYKCRRGPEAGERAPAPEVTKILGAP